MTINYEALNLGILAPSTALPTHIKGTMLSEAALYVAENPASTIAVQQYTSSAFTFIIKSCSCTQPVELTTNINTTAWLWQAIYEGEKTHTIGVQKETELVKNRLLFSSLVNNSFKTTFLVSGNYTVIEILVAQPLLTEFEILFPDLLQSAAMQTSSLDTELHQHIRAILNARLSGKLWNFFIGARIKDILFHTCSKSMLTDAANVQLEEQDLLAVNKAAEIIATDVSKHFSIPELALLVGLNEFKLKKFFPLVHGKTIYAYLIHMRMLKAKELLLQNYTVKEVAAMVGYRPSDLTMSFLQQFGIKPSEFRIKKS